MAERYPVIFYNLSLGHSDKLAEAISYVHHHLGIKRDEKQEIIVSLICESRDKTLRKWISHFTNLAPYRLNALFYQREIEYERKHDPSFYDGKINNIIEKYNRNDPNYALYIMDRANGRLHVSADWRMVDRKIHLPELYTGLKFTEENKKKLGTMSIDHFIPWSFVLHDELWNLCPVFKNLNSRRGNKLPDAERYLEGFCE